MYKLMLTKEIQKDIALKIKKLRLAQNKTQEYFAQTIGISKSTYIRFENSGDGSFETFIKILQGLGKIDELENILTIQEYSPLKELQNKSPKERKRANSITHKKYSSILNKPTTTFIEHIKKVSNEQFRS